MPDQGRRVYMECIVAREAIPQKSRRTYTDVVTAQPRELNGGTGVGAGAGSTHWMRRAVLYEGNEGTRMCQYVSVISMLGGNSEVLAQP
jgi:hypothetical protein